MSDLLEDDLREVLVDRAARITPAASARLRAVDYHPRSRRLGSRRSLSALGAVGLSAARRRGRGLPARIERGARIRWMDGEAHDAAAWPACRCTTALQHGFRHPGSDRYPRPVSASIYADGSTCVDGNGIEISGGGGATSSIPAGTIELNGAGESDSDGRSDDGRRSDRCRRHERDHHAQRRKFGSGDRQERLVPGLVARDRARRDSAGDKRERHQLANLSARTTAASARLSGGRPLRQRLRLCLRGGA